MSRAVCTAHGGAQVNCLTRAAMSEPGLDGDSLDCNAELLTESIICPQTAPAPLLGGRQLGGLGVLLRPSACGPCGVGARNRAGTDLGGVALALRGNPFGSADASPSPLCR